MTAPARRPKLDWNSVLPFGKTLHREQTLAIFRLSASLVFVAFFPLLRPLAGSNQTALRLILFGYACSSLAIIARLFLASSMRSPLQVLVRASDVLWPSLICLFSGCSRSPFLLLFILALLAAPYRARAFETLAITVSSVLIVFFENTLASLPFLSPLHLVTGPMQSGIFAVRAAILLVLGSFMAYAAFWTQREQQAYATRAILRRLRADADIQNNLRQALTALLSIFEARGVVLVLRNSSNWRVFQWGAHRDNGGISVCRDVPAADEDKFFWPMPAEAWSIACSKGSSSSRLLALDREGRRVSITTAPCWAGLLWHQPFHTMLATTLQFGSEWTGRIFLIDSPCAAGRESSLRLLQQIAEEVGPSIYNFYRWQHTSVRVRAAERQRVARDLHDGVVQSLIATDMQLELLRRQYEKRIATPNVSATLRDAQNLLRVEVRRLRMQIDQLRSNPVPHGVLPRLSQMLAEFERETGIVTKYVCNVQEESIPRKISTDVIRILEEALSNVRKHSGARRVEVQLTFREDTWEVVIQDDGRGFDFTGRFSLAQLEAARKGPRVIRERVHSVNGDLVLESHPNQGARLEIRFAVS